MGVGAQTLVTYNFNNNDLNPTAPDPLLNPLSLNYYYPPSTPAYFDNRLRFRNSGDEVRLLFNGTSFGGLNVSFTAWAGALFGGINANVKVYLKVGSGTENIIATQNLSAQFLGWDEYNFSIPIPAANNQSNVQIRIVGTITSDWGGIEGFGIDNLVLSSNSPKIQPYGYNNTSTLAQIAQNAVASTAYGTYFGIVNTDDSSNPNSATRVFRISNPGNAALQISGITFSGDNPGDFSWVTSPATPAPSTPAAVNPINSFPATINAGASRDFIVRFNPSADGQRSALLNIASNADPSVYSFYVEGRGSTCETIDYSLKRNTMEDSQSGQNVLPATLVSGSFNKVWGHSRASNNLNSNSLGGGTYGTRLYWQDSDNKPLFTSSNTSWYVRNQTSTVLFGPVDISNENGVYISFNVAAFSTESGTQSRNSFNNDDYVELQVLKPGTNNDWSRELIIRGNSTGTGSSTRYSYDIGKTAETFYDGDDSSFLFQNSTGNNNKYSKVKLKLPDNEDFEDLIFRIVVHSSHNNKLWLIDDVAVSSANVIERRWTGSSWRDANNNSVPAPNEANKTYKNYKTIFEGNYNVPSTGLTICECVVNSGVNLTVPNDNYLAVQTKITNLGSGTNFVVENKGHLIQIEDNAVNSGSITVNKTFTFSGNPTNQLQFNFLSSPVVGQNIKQIFSPTPSTLAQTYNEGTNYFNNNTGDYETGKGFAVREPVGSSGTATAKFLGTPFNGRADIPLVRSQAGADYGYNLIGNPYPSNIDIKAIYDLNTTLIEPTIYFWDNRGNDIWEQQGGGSGGYDGDSYATYNAIANAGVEAGAPADNAPPDNTKIPTRYVTKGTGFIVQAKQTGTLRLINSYRSSSAGTDFAGKGNFNPEADDRYWLTITTPTDFQEMMVVTYIENGNDEFWKDDSETMGTSDDLYSIVDGHQLSIQGKKPFNQNDEVPLGYRAFNTGTHIISVLIKEGVFEDGQDIYLIDHLLNKEWNLSERPYKFVTRGGEYNDRFTIVYRPQDFAPTFTKAPANQINFEKKDHQIVVTSSIDKIKDIEIFDLNSRSVYKKTDINANSFGVEVQAFRNQIIVVSVITETGEFVSKKFVNN